MYLQRGVGGPGREGCALEEMGTGGPPLPHTFIVVVCLFVCFDFFFTLAALNK